MNSRTAMRELAAAGALLASYPLDLIARRGEPLLNSQHSEPVVLAHGLGGSRANLLALATYLRIAGFGNISYFEYPRWQPITDSAAELGGMVRALADEHGGAHLIGHSLGGTIARHYASGAPRGEVRSLITLGSPYWFSQWSPDEVAVFGDEDPIVPPPPEHVANGNAFGKMVVLRSTGHLALLYHPEVLRIAGTELRARRAK